MRMTAQHCCSVLCPPLLPAGLSSVISAPGSCSPCCSSLSLLLPPCPTHPPCCLPQALLYAATFTNYDLGAPVNPLPREGGVVNIPFCLSLFNFATLDDFSRFVNNENRTSSVGDSAAGFCSVRVVC